MEAERERLLGDLTWLGTLARILVGDPALADDACQEAWLAASARGTRTPDRDRLLQAFRSFVWRTRRGERRRSRREASAAHTEALPSTEELIIRGEQQRRLWERLTELEDPFRPTLLLRFQEGLDARTIAQRLGVRHDTVRWRVRRGLELLREAIERDEEGGGLAGLALAIPMSMRPGGGGAPASIHPAPPLPSAASSVGIGALWMSKTANVALTAVLMTIAGVTVWNLTAHRRGAASASLSTGENPVAPVNDTLDERELATAFTVPEAADRSTVERPEVEAVETEPQARLTGVVVDEAGAPLAGALVRVTSRNSWKREGTADRSGKIEIVTPVQSAEEVSVEIGGLEWFEEGQLHLGSTRRCSHEALVDERLGAADIGTITLRNAGIVVARLVDTEGHPVAEAWITCDKSPAPAQSNFDGRFRLTSVLPGPQAMDVIARGLLDHEARVSVRAGSTNDFGEIVLRDGPLVRGRVTDLGGTPLPDATVSSRGFTRGWLFEVGADGRFEIPMPALTARGIAARAPGHIQSEALLAEPGADVHIRLESTGEPCRFLIVDGVTDEPVTRFGLRIQRNSGSAAPDPVARGWGPAPANEHGDNLVETVA